MACAIVTSVDELIQSVRDLQERVAVLIPSIELPDNLTTLCGDGDGLIQRIYNNVSAFVVEAGEDISEANDRPVEEFCHTGTYMFKVKEWIYGIDIVAATICDLNLDSSGGDEGYDETFSAGNGGYTLSVQYEMYQQKDRLILYDQAGSILFDTGCTSGGDTVLVDVPEGVTSIRVVIEPNCEGGSGTAWNLSITCI